ncbi:MAG: chemotaxis protein MotB [bacterium]|jgi:chemotaxis protein MotB
MSEEQECPECEEGAPAWLATFADLMSLLMCFFVLLLSFSEMDLKKYKQVAGSMSSAFGIQREVKSDTIPKGTSIIKMEFSPGKPEPTILKVVKQKTTDDSKRQIDVNTPISKSVERLLSEIEDKFSEEIREKSIDVVVIGDSVMIRVREADAFPSGNAEIQQEFVPVLEKLVEVLAQQKGNVMVAGHTDNIPISTSRYRSNWILSAARAASVVHYLSEVKSIDPARFEIRAYADTQPVADNDSSVNRARNRRIEINISTSNEED